MKSNRPTLKSLLKDIKKWKRMPKNLTELKYMLRMYVTSGTCAGHTKFIENAYKEFGIK